MDKRVTFQHIRRKQTSAPPPRNTQPNNQFAVFVILPPEAVCTIRNVPCPVTTVWLKGQVELLSGITADNFTLQYPDGSTLPEKQKLRLHDKFQKAIVLRLRFLENYESLWTAVNSNNWEIVAKEIGNSVTDYNSDDNDASPTGSRRPDRKFCALFLASSLGKDNICGNILLENADINGRTRFGHTALHAAACRNNFATVEILLKHGAYPSHCNVFRETPFQTAVSRSAIECAKKLRFAPFARVRSASPEVLSTDRRRETTSEGIKPKRRGRLEALLSDDALSSVRKGCRRAEKAMVGIAKAMNIESRRSHKRGAVRVGFVEADVQANDSTKTCSHRRKEQNGCRVGSALSSCRTNMFVKYNGRTSVDLGNILHFRKMSKDCGSNEFRRSVSENERNESEQIFPNDSFTDADDCSDSSPTELTQRGKGFELQAPFPSPESLDASSKSSSPELLKDGPQAETRHVTYAPINDGRYRSQTSKSHVTNTERTSPKPVIRDSWISMKRTLRLAYLQDKAQAMKAGQNDAAFKNWLDRKNKERKAVQTREFEESQSEADEEESGEAVFQKWLQKKKETKKNYRDFVGDYKSVFLIGNTMGGEAKYPDSAENKDAYRKWLESRKDIHMDIPTGLTSSEIKDTKPYKDMEARRRQMLTSAVTYEEWLDAKYAMEQFSKEIESLQIKEKQKLATEAMKAKTLKQLNYDKWTRDSKIGKKSERKVKYLV